MDVRLRIQTIPLIEQMDKHPEHAKELGLENGSEFEVEKKIHKIRRKKNEYY